jgi:hypothetical protein
MSAVLSKARTGLIALGESLAGRPPFRLRARAAFGPATSRSGIRLRSNSASVRQLSPLGWEQINLTGDYTWRSDKRVAKRWF